ncbi:PREDICTED: uncharacterized protein LOC105451876 isoform X1 [Wasmannia auropunctata]|uniref:uncharacterized protein LOC105451876 isoform X1 n=1 Tax=Wasmannia auropunctata TaxID=64793 RepID=UPI0005EE170A|nr:PREDICTED: uncharacterized protein LOC105451876 isoform X1 [Wasmannia auropunctata]
MRKRVEVPSKRSLTKLPRLGLPQKPYGFCCEEKDQDPEKRYDMRNPPFTSSLTDVVLGAGGPGVKFRVQDIGPPPYPIQRRILEAKGRAYLGRCKRCRGPLRWYLEDEIALARDFLAKERRDNYNATVKRNLMIAKRKARKRSSTKKRNLKITSEITQDNQQFEK